MATAGTRHWAEALEPRLLHSADLSPLLLAGGVGSEHQAVLDTTADEQTGTATEIVFIDTALPDAGTLLADLQAQQAAGRPLEVVLLDSGDDALAVIGDTLAGRSGVAAIHLLGHGGDGLLQIGATRLDADTVLQRAGELAAWRGALAPGADLLIYGCNVAAGDSGRALVADIAALTGADVAASDDLTGAAAAGGDWVLEVRSGSVDTLLAPSLAAQQAYAATLAVEVTRTESKKSGSNTDSLRWQHNIDNSSERLLVVQIVVGSQFSTTAVNYGGQALTLLARQDSSSVLGALRTEVWYLLAPAVGSADVTVTSSFAVDIVGGSTSFTNVDESSPFGPVVREANHNSSITLSVAAASGDAVIDVLGSKGVDTGSYGSGQAELWDQTQGAQGGDLWGSASRENGAAAVTMSQRLTHTNGGERWVYIAVAVKSGSNTAPTIASNGGGANASLSVAENSSSVTTVAATDPQNGALTYSISGGADAARFAIDANSGALRFVAAPNAEVRADANTDNVYEVTVRVSDGTLTDSQALAVTVSDVNEFAVGAVADTNPAADQVLESAALGSSVGVTANATDADAGNNTVSYSLSDNAGGRFSIDPATGVVRVAAALDRETAASHTIVVRAASSDGSSRTRSFSIAVADVDEFDTGPLSDSDNAANQVSENAGLGSTVGITAQASDADATTSTISYSLDDNAGGRFAIDAASGVLRVAGVLDFETAASHNLVVRATSADGSASTTSFTVIVTDNSESGVGTVADSDAGANLIDENLAPGAATGLTAQASDPDPGDSISYTLLDDAGGRFAIDPLTGAVRSALALDAEAANGWDITVRAASSDGSSTWQTFTIGVRDLDEFDVGAPVDTDATADAVEENTAIGSSVGIVVAASDGDASSNAVSYTLLDDAGGRFAIDSNSGSVSVAGALDRESAASHNITVRATSADGSSAQTSFTIAVADVNEFYVAAIVDADANPNTVDEAAAAGTPAGITASAADADATGNTINYSLLDDAGGRFAIDAASGVVRVAGGLDFETAASHRITVRATSADGSSTSSDYTVAVGAANDNTPLFVSGAAALVTENNRLVATVLASDADLPAPDIAYSISGGADAALFVIDAATGVLSFAAAPDFEQPLDTDRDNRYQVDVTASDGSRSASQSLVVTVADANETPLLTSHAGNARVGLAVTEGGTAVTTVAASDPEGSALTYRISGGADRALFAVDATTGVLRWIGAPDFETPRDSGADNAYDVTVAANDGVNDAVQGFSVSVGNRNETPAAGRPLAAAAASEDSAFTLTLPAAAFGDVDAGDTLAWSARLATGAVLPAWLAFDAATRTFSGTPANVDVGSLVLRVSVADVAGAGAWQDFTLTVANTNDTPLAGSPLPALAAFEGAQFAFALPGGALSDPDSGDRLQFSAALASGQPLPAWLSFDAADQVFSGTPAAADITTLAIRITATDSSGAQASTDFDIVVQTPPVITPPVIDTPLAAPPAIVVTPPADAASETAPAEEPQAAPPPASTQAPPEAAPDLLPPTPTLRDDPSGASSTPAAAATLAPPQHRSNGSSAADAMLAPAVLPQFASLGYGATTTASWLQGGDMQRNYEVVQQQLQQAAEQRRTAMASGVAISGGLSIGYVVWLVRGGVLMSSMLSTLPAWKMLDPLPVLAAASASKPRRGRKDADPADDVERLFDEGEPSKPAATPQRRAADNKIAQEIET